MTPAEQLRAAKALIDTPEKWTQNGNFHEIRNYVRCSCAWGALARVARSPGFSGYGEALYLLNWALPPAFNSLPRYNDRADTTHPDIMSLFDRAIARAEKSDA